MLIHYLSREMRNFPPSIALCGVTLTPEQLDWTLSPAQPAPYTMHPCQITCADCQEVMARALPREHWSRKVELNQSKDSSHHYEYAVDYPTYFILKSKGPEEKWGTVGPDSEPVVQLDYSPDPQYLAFQNIYDIQKIVAAAANQDPWLHRIQCVNGAAADQFNAAAQQLERTSQIATATRNDATAASLTQATLTLKDLSHRLKKTKPNANGQILLDDNQQDALNQAWHNMEGYRRSKASNYFEKAAPGIDNARHAPELSDRTENTDPSNREGIPW